VSDERGTPAEPMLRHSAPKRHAINLFPGAVRVLKSGSGPRSELNLVSLFTGVPRSLETVPPRPLS